MSDTKVWPVLNEDKFKKIGLARPAREDEPGLEVCTYADLLDVQTAIHNGFTQQQKITDLQNRK